MKTKIYIDGSEGTTGLRIFERMAKRDDVELIKIDPELRKDPTARAKCINASDITFLCLPDAAAVEAVSLVSNDNVRIIDASTAHASVLPPNVEPWSPIDIADATLSLASTAPIATPQPSPLALVIMSGTTPYC